MSENLYFIFYETGEDNAEKADDLVRMYVHFLNILLGINLKSLLNWIAKAGTCRSPDFPIRIVFWTLIVCIETAKLNILPSDIF